MDILCASRIRQMKKINETILSCIPNKNTIYNNNFHISDNKCFILFFLNFDVGRENPSDKYTIHTQRAYSLFEQKEFKSLIVYRFSFGFAFLLTWAE